MPSLGRIAKGIGKTAMVTSAIAAGSTALAAGNVATAGYGFASNYGEYPEPKDTPLTDVLMDFAFGDPQADRAFLGRDLGFSTFYPMPSWMTLDPLRAAAGIIPGASQLNEMARQLRYAREVSNPTMNRFAFASRSDFTSDFHNTVANAGGINREYPYMQSTAPYVPRQTRSAASGDIVFGQYNLRHSGY